MADETRRDEGRGGAPRENDLTGRTADAPPRGREGQEREGQGREGQGQGHAGGPDALDRAAEEEVQEGGPGVHEPEGAAFPNPGGGAVVAPSDDETRDPATTHPDDGLGAGDALRGGGSGPLPPGTARPLPGEDPEDPEGRARVSLEERDFGRDAAALGGGVGAARAGGEPAAGPLPGDGPTAREARPDAGGGLSPEAEAMRALGVEAGRNGWVLWVLGIAAIVAGAVALAMPLVASVAANAVVAAMLLASGVVGLVISFRRRDGGAIAAGFALSALAAVTGVVMLLAPLAGIVALSTLIIAFFLASGVARIWYGVRQENARGRGWLVAAGVVSILLALMLWFAFPGAALWLPGVFLAVDLILYGAMMIALAVFGRPKLDAERLG